MNLLSKLADLVPLFRRGLVPTQELEAAMGRLGPALSEWAIAFDTASRGEFARAWAERSHDEYAGLQAWLKQPLRIEWGLLTARYGAAEEELAALDNWGGPIPFGFAVPAEGPALGVSVTLWLTPADQDESGWAGAGTPVKPLVERLSIRRVRG